MTYLTVMNMVCFCMIAFLLVENGITVQDFAFWGINLLIIVIQVATTLYCKEAFKEKNDEQG